MTDQMHLHWIQCAYRTVKRGGNFIIEVFKKENMHLTPDDCLKLKDLYGIRPSDIVKLAISHEFTLDIEGFADLLDKEDIQNKLVKPLACHEENCN